MKYRDAYGNLLQYGDVIENLDTHDIGVIVRSTIDDTPMLFLLREFSWRDLNYKDVAHNAAPACYERSFIPKRSSLYWRAHKYCIPNVELLRHGERNRRVKEI